MTEDGGRVAWVSGGASGIGLATVERLLQDGWRVVLADINVETGTRAVEDLTKAEPSWKTRIAFARTDVAEEDEISRSIGLAVERFGELHAVVNNAGLTGVFGPIDELDVAGWDFTFSVLVRSVMLGTKHAVKAFKAVGRGGAIINLGSIAGLGGGSGPQGYSAAKAAVLNLTQTTALELAPFRIRVNAVVPGVIETPLTRTGRRDIGEAMKGIQPWPDMGQPRHVAAAIAFLASDDAEFITGEMLRVDGGLIAAGPRLGDAIGGDPASRGLSGINRGTTGLGHSVRKRESNPPGG